LLAFQQGKIAGKISSGGGLLESDENVPVIVKVLDTESMKEVSINQTNPSRGKHFLFLSAHSALCK